MELQGYTGGVTAWWMPLQKFPMIREASPKTNLDLAQGPTADIKTETFQMKQMGLQIYPTMRKTKDLHRVSFPTSRHQS
jgi:hypothetical protein